MTQKKRLHYLIQYLLNEQPEYKNMNIPSNEEDQKKLLRSLMNIRPPYPITQTFLQIQDEYLQEELNHAKITDMSCFVPIKDRIYLWKGDITKLKVDAIVNAANKALLGCFIPCHGCIDNAIHSYAGIQLRLECQRIMEKQGVSEAIGQAKITKGYNLPAKYVLHTVGPMIKGQLNEEVCQLLASCYQSCLELAIMYKLKSIAFCCISTGEFHFPNDIAAKIAVDTVTEFLNQTNSEIEVVFNVFKDKDYQIYKQLLG